MPTKCPPIFNIAYITGAKGPGLSPGPLLFDRYEEVGKVANSGAQGVLYGFAGLMADGQDGHPIAEH